MARRTKGEGSIYQRKDGRWTAQYYIDGEKKTNTYGTQAKAKARLLEVNTALSQGNFSNPGSKSLGQWLDEWLENYAKTSIKLSTYISYETYIRAHIKPSIGNTKLKNLSVDILQRFLMDKTKSGRADNRKGGLPSKTVNNIHKMLHAALQQATENGLISRNYTEGVRPPKKEDHEMRVLNRNEQTALIKACRNTNDPACFGIIFSMFTGIRPRRDVGVAMDKRRSGQALLHHKRIVEPA